MKQFCSIIIIVCSLLLVPACKKEIKDTPSDEEVPVFYFNGNVNAAPVNLQAGVNDYYMYSFFKQDSSTGVYSFFGNLKQVNCQNNSCINHITFQINDNHLSPLGSPTNIDTLLLPGRRLQYSPIPALDSNAFQFTSQPMTTNKPQSFSWDFGDGTTSTLQNPIHSYQSAASYLVCHTTVYDNGCSGQICNRIEASTHIDCEASIDYTISAIGDTVQFFGSGTGPSLNYSWSFNDSTSSSDSSKLQNPVHIFSKKGVFKVRLIVSNSLGCSTTIYKNVVTNNFNGACFANFKYTKTAIPALNLSNVTITWVNSAGLTFSSNRIVQPADSFFEVLSFDEYALNENNKRTRKIHAKFKCLVSDGNTSFTITDADAIFAIAYP